MSIAPPTQAAPKAQRRRLVAIGLLRASATTIVLIAAYYLLPLDRLSVYRWRCPWRSGCSH
jgi:hypothetical protein